MNNTFVLMHQNTMVASVILRDNKTVEKIYAINPAMLPFGEQTSQKLMSTWWEQRSIPESRHNLQDILAENQCDSSLMLMVKNLALSLTDTYWIRPASMEDLSWEQVNLFASPDQDIVFRSPDGEEFSKHPIGTLNGSLEKHAVYKEDGWYLQKKSETIDGIQSVNEKIACMIHEAQGWTEYTPYMLYTNSEGICEKCESKYFTSADRELVTAFELANMLKRDNAVSIYDQIINTAGLMGLDKGYVREFMDYQTLTDFVMTNSDRHLYNFGILRDPATMRAVSMAPIFDSGNSMFFRNPFVANKRESILASEITAIKDKEEKMLKLVKNINAVKSSLLPSPKDIAETYMKYGIDEEEARLIAKGYSLKLDMLREFQHGIQVSLFHEQHNCKTEKPCMNAQFNPKYFEAHPEELFPAVIRQMVQDHQGTIVLQTKTDTIALLDNAAYQQMQAGRVSGVNDYNGNPVIWDRITKAVAEDHGEIRSIDVNILRENLKNQTVISDSEHTRGTFILLCGLPLSGKTHEAEKLLKNNPDAVIVSLSNIRKQFYDEQTSHQVARQMITEGIQAGKDVIYDAINLKPETRSSFLDCAKEAGSTQNTLLYIVPNLKLIHERAAKANFDLSVIDELYHAMKANSPEKDHSEWDRFVVIRNGTRAQMQDEYFELE